MNLICRFLLIFGLITQVNCSNQKVSGKWRTKSAIKNEELGLLVDNVSFKQVQQMLQKKVLDARIISLRAGIFEIYGISKGDAQKLFPYSNISENHFIPLENTKPVKIEPKPTHLQNHLRIIEAAEAWKINQGQKIKVAIIDTGLNFQHPEFENTLVTNDKDPVNGQDDDGNGFTDDYWGWNFGDGNGDLSDLSHHGTSVASIINSPSAGVAPQTKVLVLKVANSNQVIDEASVIAALQYVLSESPVDIINISFGKTSINPLLRKTLRIFEEKQILVNAGIGNSGLECDLIKVFPASFHVKNILKIGASTLDIENMFQLASYSNFGTCVDLLAPSGEQKDGIRVPYYVNEQPLYTRFNGTSAATPIVTGVAALIKSQHPDLNSSDLKKILLKSGKKDPTIKGLSKGGIINAVLALKNANEYHPTP